MRIATSEKIGHKIKCPVEIKVGDKAGVNFQNHMSPEWRLKGIFDMGLGWIIELHDKNSYCCGGIYREKSGW